MLGTRGAMQRRQAGLDGRHRWLSECGWNLYWMHHAGFPRQVHAVYESAARLVAVFGGGADLWTSDSCPAAVYAGLHEQRTRLAQTRASEVELVGRTLLSANFELGLLDFS